jgi:tRNA(fMet)-specific endonuclease VapC
VERRSVEWPEFIAPDDDVAIAAVTAAELLVGVQLADAERRPGREEFVEGVLSIFPVEEYDLAAARAHALLLAETRRLGRQRGAHDLIIAAIAVSRNRIVVSADRAAFEDLPGVSLRLIG